MIEHPIPVTGVSSGVCPNNAMPIALYWHAHEGINWSKLGAPATRQQLLDAIALSAGFRLPNELLPALCPGDVVVLADGTFWISRNWQVEAIAGGPATIARPPAKSVY
ncbi:hypothetical protein ACQ4M4_12685 [Leptolyngbya sp. AN02str]|uniref:hypothetical protein n=1 Tax=Leptolyngbya sp. AN02str TaxID=3423363 RepID=UPI003D321E28